VRFIQAPGRLDLGDSMLFEVQPDSDHPEIRNDGMRYEGYRYRAECRLAGAVYGRPFGVDVAFGDPLIGEPDRVVARDILGLAGIAPPTLRLYPVVSHIVEKLHALTMPRSRPSSRVRDLPDIALLATTGLIEGAKLRLALETTFGFRGTHSLPASVPAPPAFWAEPYAAMASSDELIWASLVESWKPCQHSWTPCSLRPIAAPGIRGTGSGDHAGAAPHRRGEPGMGCRVSG
jgi:Nucleotidyl transferase AbiEii toxin, Type IV TA system